jgi:replicative DNA helicase
MLRLVTSETAWEAVEKRLTVWQGPPPEDIAANPLLLLEMARYADATLVVPDSLKDFAMKLSDDAIGAKVNQAFQHLVADGRDVVAPHHVRKVGRQDSDKGITIDDLYGSVWIFNGAGSVVYLEKGPVDVELRQLKTPNGREASLRFALSASGEAFVGDGDPVLAAVREAGDVGVSTSWAAACLFHKDKPSDAEIERVRKRLVALEGLGMVQRDKAGRSSKWVAV